jgi:hypothetical protein
MCEKAEVGVALATAKQKRAREREEKKHAKAKEPSGKELLAGGKSKGLVVDLF